MAVTEIETAERPRPAPARTAGPAPDDVRPVENPTVDRLASAVFMVVPFLLVIFAAWYAWDKALHWQDIAIFVFMYLFTGVGVTVGFHRLLTHRSFKTGPATRFLFAALGSAAVEGPVIEWVATHRKHHRFSDAEGDPHSPHVGHEGGWRGAFSGLVYAHMGWVLRDTEVASEQKYASDLIADRGVRFVSDTFVLWVLAGLALPFGLGVALTGSIDGGLTGMLWGGAVRIFVLHHFTFSINSLCHFFGRRRFETRDESRNLAWLALPTMGEAWHNNHHAFPTSARHGLGRFQVDPSAGVIWALERLGLAWDVVRITPERQREKADQLLAS